MTMLEKQELNLDTNEDSTSDAVIRTKSAIRFIRYLLLLIMVTMALLFLFTNKDKLTIDNFRRLLAKIDIGLSMGRSIDKSVIDFEYREEGSVAIFKDGMARLTSERLVITDNIGTQFQNVLTGFDNPQLVTTKKYVLAYDRGGKRLIISNSFAVLFEENYDNSIITAVMNDNGYLAVVKQANGYKASVIVYNEQFREIFRWNSLHRYIINIDISSDNKSIIVSSLYTEGANVIPQINCFKLNETDISWSVDFKENAAPLVVYKNDGTICGLFEWGMIFLDRKGNEKGRYQFGGYLLQSFDIGKEKQSALIMSHSISGNSELFIIDNNGKLILQTDLNEYIQSVSLYGGRVALLSSKKIKALQTANGKEIWQVPNDDGALKISFSDKNSILVVSSSHAVYNIID